MGLRPPILVLSPHADDEVLGCCSVLTEADAHVVYIGIDDFHVVDRDDRLHEVERVAALCSFTWEVLDFPVNSYGVDLARLVGALEQVINAVRPHSLFLPGRSYNQDHRAVHDAAVTATRRHDHNWQVDAVFRYEGPDNFLWPRYPFRPTYFRPVDVDRKLQALALHASQARGHRSPDVIRAMTTCRGLQAGLDGAEAFEVLRLVEAPRGAGPC